eukprot:GDKI01031491.1.p1 GENE.GDKI01031491.1~~GDKI01031491.1.p1  ORF type:complete len:723 (+),score=144.84 GDKI01031491.1:78-2246(+)
MRSISSKRHALRSSVSSPASVLISPVFLQNRINVALNKPYSTLAPTVRSLRNTHSSMRARNVLQQLPKMQQGRPFSSNTRSGDRLLSLNVKDSITIGENLPRFQVRNSVDRNLASGGDLPEDFPFHETQTQREERMEREKREKTGQYRYNLEDIEKQKKKHTLNMKKKQIQKAVLYANPICSQLDQLILKADNFDELLTTLVTHRGVFFVHNLVTAVQCLAVISEDATSLEINELLRDERYEVLLSDLKNFKDKLDFEAIAMCVTGLQKLGHKYYHLFSAFFEPLMTVPIDPTQLPLVVECANAYLWCGYFRHPFFDRCAHMLAERMERDLTRGKTDTKSDVLLTAAQITSAVRMFSQLETYSPQFFAVSEQIVLRNFHAFTPTQMAHLAKGFAAHLRPKHDSFYTQLARYVAKNGDHFTLRETVAVLRAFRQMALYFETPMVNMCERLGKHIQTAVNVRQETEITVKEITHALECVAFFGMQNNPQARFLVQKSMEYLEDRIDLIDEGGCIKGVYALAVFGMTAEYNYLLSFLWRKIGQTTYWEKEKYRVFHLFLCQLIQFPWLEAKIPKRCVYEGMRQWGMQRGGMHSPFPEEVKEVSAKLRELSVRHKCFIPQADGPYTLDIVLAKRRTALMVVSECARNTLDPCGGTVLEFNHLRLAGWNPIAINRRHWRTLSEEERGVYLSELLTQIVGSEGVGGESVRELGESVGKGKVVCTKGGE